MASNAQDRRIIHTFFLPLLLSFVVDTFTVLSRICVSCILLRPYAIICDPLPCKFIYIFDLGLTLLRTYFSAQRTSCCLVFLVHFILNP